VITDVDVPAVPASGIAVGTGIVIIGDEILFAQRVVSRDEVIAHGMSPLMGCEIGCSAGDFPLTSTAAVSVKGLSLDTSGGVNSVREITRQGRESEPRGERPTPESTRTEVHISASECSSVSMPIPWAVDPVRQLEELSTSPSALARGAGVWTWPLGRCPSGGAGLGWEEARGEGWPWYIPGTRGRGVAGSPAYLA
jgi:hypothetical protein